MRDPLRRIDRELHEALLGNFRSERLRLEFNGRLAVAREAALHEVAEDHFAALAVARPAAHELPVAQRAEDRDEIVNAPDSAQAHRDCGGRSRIVTAGEFDIEDPAAAFFGDGQKERVWCKVRLDFPPRQLGEFTPLIARIETPGPLAEQLIHDVGLGGSARFESAAHGDEIGPMTLEALCCRDASAAARFFAAHWFIHPPEEFPIPGVVGWFPVSRDKLHDFFRHSQPDWVGRFIAPDELRLKSGQFSEYGRGVGIIIRIVNPERGLGFFLREVKQPVRHERERAFRDIENELRKPGWRMESHQPIQQGS